MLFTRLTVENFGLFRGKHAFDLGPQDPEKPIVLFGGKNGAGKTTLFEAVRLCLYSNSFQGYPLSRAKYEEYLRSRIHRYRGIDVQPDTASVGLEFEYVQFGQKDRYEVKRTWKRGESRVADLLQIYRNGEDLGDVESEQWQDFLKELIPQGVSKLFFFDGEKIQHLAEDEPDNTYLRESLHSLLGLDIVEHLQSDLKIHMTRQRRHLDTETEKTIKDLKKQKDELTEKLQKLRQNRAQLQNEIDNTVAHVERHEHKIAKEGGSFANKREEMKVLKGQLDKEIEIVENRIRELCVGLLPFALIPDFLRMVSKRIVEEQRYRELEASRKKLDETLHILQESIEDPTFWHDVELSSQDRMKLTERISVFFKERVKPTSDVQNFRPLHQLSMADERKILEWIDFVLNDSPTELKELTQELESLSRQRQKVETSLSRIPPDDILHPLLEDLKRMNNELGALQQKSKTLDEAIRQTEFKHGEVMRQLRKQLDLQEGYADILSKNDLASRVLRALDTYKVGLREAKIQSLSENLLTCINELSHKKAFERVEIDPQNFAITLYGPDRNPIPKEQLSAGEKQIYAIAMLWALARTSGRPLPFIIDTPLGRLDSDHRLNLIDNFFPRASHQVIIFSTDTEIDQRYFEELQPFISRVYHLEFDRDEGQTSVSEGYFWKFSEVAAK